MLKSMSRREKMRKDHSFYADKDIVEHLSKNLNEPDWFLNYRLKALKAINELEPPKIERLNYSDWKLWQVPDVHLEVTSRTHNQSCDHEALLISDIDQRFI